MIASLSTFYKNINSVFEQLKLLLQLVLTYPITSNEAERSFSKLKLLLAPTRATMRDARLNHLALMGAHRNRLARIPTEFIVNKFKEQLRHARLADTVSDHSDEGSFYLFFFHLEFLLKTLTLYLNFIDLMTLRNLSNQNI